MMTCFLATLLLHGTDYSWMTQMAAGRMAVDAGQLAAMRVLHASYTQHVSAIKARHQQQLLAMQAAWSSPHSPELSTPSQAC